MHSIYSHLFIFLILSLFIYLSVSPFICLPTCLPKYQVCVFTYPCLYLSYIYLRLSFIKLYLSVFYNWLWQLANIIALLEKDILSMKEIINRIILQRMGPSHLGNWRQSKNTQTSLDLVDSKSAPMVNIRGTTHRVTYRYQKKEGILWFLKS